MDEVDALLADRAHPLADTVHAVRAELRAVPGAAESVKWNAPNYALADDFATLQLRRDDVVQLVLHTGAKAKPEHPEIAVSPLPPFARKAARNRLVLTFTAAHPADLVKLRRVLDAWVAQLA